MGDNLRYGRFCRYPSCLQCLNTIQVAVCFISIANCFQTMSYSLVGVMISTIEKRYDLSSVQSSWIASAGDLGPLPVLAFITYFGNRIHRPRSIGLGLLSISIGCIAFFIPQFTSPLYDSSSGVNKDTNAICRTSDNYTNHVIGSCDKSGESSHSYYLPLFIISRLLIGLGSAPVISLAVSYMADCSTKEKFGTYSGIYNSMNIVGPAIGFLVGGIIIDVLYVDFYAVQHSNIGFSSKDPRWIGAWWFPYVVSAAFCLLVALPMFGYARDLPGAADIRMTRSNEAYNNNEGPTLNGKNSSELQYTRSFAEFRALFKDLFTNPTFLFLSIFVMCDMFVISGFTAFGAKFLQFYFSMPASRAALLFGAVLLPAGAIGTILGGVIIEKSKMSCNQIVRVMFLLSLLVCASIFVLLVTCKTTSFVGINTAYTDNSNSSSKDEAAEFNLTNACNVDCGCQDYGFSPVCSHDNVQFFSACHAGCRNYSVTGDQKVSVADEPKEYRDCSCISAPLDSSSYVATSDVCTSGTCSGSIAFLVVLFMSVGVMYMTLTMNLSATTRCVKSSQTSSAIAIQVMIVRGLGSIPGPILMGLAFDNSCAYWVYNECGERTSCAMYHHGSLSLNLFLTCIVVKCIGTIAILLAAVLYKSPPAVQVDGPEVIETSDIKY